MRSRQRSGRLAKKSSDEPGNSTDTPDAADADSEDVNTVVLRAKNDGVAALVTLTRVPGGMYVNREERAANGAPWGVSFVAATQHQFQHWLEHDPGRFRHPDLHIAITRAAPELWSRSAG